VGPAPHRERVGVPTETAEKVAGADYGLLAEHGERIVCDGDFADCYAEGRGRPSIPPSTLAKILLLELAPFPLTPQG